MKFEDYVKDRKRVFANQPRNKETYNLLWGSNSLGGETGEFQNIVKKIYRDFDQSINNHMKEELISELGDVLWYWLFVCDILQFNPEDIMEYNLVKLKKRYGIS